MKAIVLKDFGGSDQLSIQEISKPSVLSNEVLIKVKAIGINPVDVKTRKGKGQAARLKNEHTMILGWDVSGVVEEAGAAVNQFRKGDEVFGMINLPGIGRAYAEYVAAPAEHVVKKPANTGHVQAAAAGIAAVTAYQALVNHGELQPGMKILIHAAAGGVGHYAVQIAKHIGAYVIGTSSAGNKESVMRLGADQHIDYRLKPFEEQIKEVDFVLDTIGGENIDRSLRILRPGGTIVALPSGLSESVSEKAAAQGKKGIFFFAHSGPDMQHIANLLESGAASSFVTKEFSFDEMAAAHDLVESGKATGKIVVTL